MRTRSRIDTLSRDAAAAHTLGKTGYYFRKLARTSTGSAFSRNALREVQFHRIWNSICC